MKEVAATERRLVYKFLTRHSDRYVAATTKTYRSRFEVNICAKLSARLENFAN
jgi:hypothetical protein